MKIVFLGLFLISQTIGHKPCYEKGSINIGQPLKIFNNRVNWLENIESVEDCISLCGTQDYCNWWNYDPVQMICWLKTGRGFTKIPDGRNGSSIERMLTGPRDSIQQCYNKDLSVSESFEDDTYDPDNIVRDRSRRAYGTV